MSAKYYLKPNAQAEPLIWQWYAWSHLIAPTTAACNIVDHHIKVMKSYIQSPQFHAEAVNNPAQREQAWVIQLVRGEKVFIGQGMIIDCRLLLLTWLFRQASGCWDFAGE